MYTLILRDKAEILKQFEVKRDRIVIGSDQKTNLKIKHQMISSKHCEISRVTINEYQLTDLKSAFGTYLNKKKITSSVKLSPNDIITIGPYELEFIADPKNIDTQDMRYCLSCISGKIKSKRYLLNRTITRIGRDSTLNDIVIPETVDNSVSRRHATIIKNNDNYIITDKRSKNRTKVNNKILREDDEISLKLNDEIEIGKEIFRFTKYTDKRLKKPIKNKSILVFAFSRVLLWFFSYLLLFTILYSTYEIVRNINLILKKPESLNFSIKNLDLQIPSKQIMLIPTPQNLVYDTQKSNIILPLTILSIIEKLISKGQDVLKILTVTLDGYIYLWDINSRPKLLSQVPDPSLSYPTISDFNKDNIQDVVLQTNELKISIIDTFSGNLLNKSNILGNQIFASPIAYDFNNDGIVEIVSATQDGTIHFISNPIYLSKYSSIKLDKTIITPGVVYKSKNGLRVLFITTSSNIYIIDPEKQKLLSEINLNLILSAKFVNHNPLNASATPVVADLNADTKLDTAIIFDNSSLLAVNLEDQNILWGPLSLSKTGLDQDIKLHPSCLISDIDKDNNPDLIAFSADASIFLIKGNNGKIINRFKTEYEDNFIFSAALVDLSKDGIDEIIFGTKKGEVYILNPNAKEKTVIFKSKIFDMPITSTPLIADLDADEKIEILICSLDNKFKLIKTNSTCIKNQIFWSTLQADTNRQARNIFNKRKCLRSYFIIISLNILFFIFIFSKLLLKPSVRKQFHIIK